MQNKYVGDVGDFGKYGLLRFLSGLKEDSTSDLGLRLASFGTSTLTTLIARTAGSHTTLQTAQSTAPDFAIVTHRFTRHFVRWWPEATAISPRFGAEGILPPDTTFYERPLPYTPGTPRPSRQANRENWLTGALEATIGSELVFFDPDNGVSEKADRFGKASLKHVFVEEIRPFLERGQSLVIYHHLSRLGKAHQQIEHLRGSLRSSLGMLRRPLALWYRRGTARVYFIAAQERHESIVEARLKGFFGRPWRTHFQLVE